MSTDHDVLPRADDGLAVEVRCCRGLAEEVARHVEAVLGWQVVGEGSGWLRPAVRLLDGSREGDAGLPAVLLVADDLPPHESARRALAAGTAEVVGWPSGRDGLAAAVGRALGAARHAPRDEPEGARLVVGGAAGGVGVTTVALAIGGLVAWAGRSALVLGRGDVPVPAVPTVAADAVGGAGTWSVAVPAPAVPRLRVVRVPGGPGGGRPLVPAGTAVIEDVGVERTVEGVLVARCDRAGAEAVAASPAGAVVVVEDGPLAVRDVAGRAAGRVVVVPRSARVARAGTGRLVPGGLPGTWLVALRPLVEDLLGVVHS